MVSILIGLIYPFYALTLSSKSILPFLLLSIICLYSNFGGKIETPQFKISHRVWNIGLWIENEFLCNIHCSDYYSAIKSLAMASIDIHAINSIKIYEENMEDFYGDKINGYSNHCDSSFRGNVNISLQPINKYL